MINDDNAVTAVAEAVARVGRYKFPMVLTPTVRAFLEQVADALGIELDLDDPETALGKIGPIVTMIGATMRNTANPTRLAAGYKDNVIPGKASATIDCRTLPGQSEIFERQLREVIGPDIEVEYIHRQPGLETTFDGPLVEAMSRGAQVRGPERAPGALHALRGYRRQTVRQARHPVLRVLAPATARRSELRRVVPRR